MAAEILITVRLHESRVAYLENGVLNDLKVERRMSPTLVGSIYRGHVSRVLPGMQAAFVDIGLDRAAFLYVGDVREGLEDGGVSLFKEEMDSDDEEAPIDFLKTSAGTEAVNNLLQRGLHGMLA